MKKRSVYVPLSEGAAQALIRLAMQRKRHPKYQAAMILERYLRNKGMLDEPPAGARRNVNSNPDAVTNLPGGAASGN